MTDVVGAKPRVAINAVQPENLFVERTGALECLDIERCFQDPEENRHFAASVCTRHCRHAATRLRLKDRTGCRAASSANQERRLSCYWNDLPLRDMHQSSY